MFFDRSIPPPVLATAISEHERLRELVLEEGAVEGGLKVDRLVVVAGILMRNAKASDRVKREVDAQLMSEVEQAWAEIAHEMAEHCPPNATRLITLRGRTSEVDEKLARNPTTGDHELHLIVDYKFK